jgi:hypothetical protein
MSNPLDATVHAGQYVKCSLRMLPTHPPLRKGLSRTFQACDSTSSAHMQCSSASTACQCMAPSPGLCQSFGRSTAAERMHMKVW